MRGFARKDMQVDVCFVVAGSENWGAAASDGIPRLSEQDENSPTART